MISGLKTRRDKYPSDFILSVENAVNGIESPEISTTTTSWKLQCSVTHYKKWSSFSLPLYKPLSFLFVIGHSGTYSYV
jgi:hypothetical protein